jgi:hypothetical protein
MKVGISEVDRAHAIYARRTLALYDWWVLGFSNHRIWQCETDRIVVHYRDHLSANHLEAGPGTGSLLAEALPALPAPPSRLALLDLNEYCLERSARRLAESAPEIHRANLLEPFQLPGAPFDSVALNYVLHCLPGKIEDKAAKVFGHLAAHLAQDGTLFGSTILGSKIRRPLAAQALMALYNAKGIFHNREDSLGGLMEALSHCFRTFNVEVRGCVVLFWGKGRRGTSVETTASTDRAG